MKKLVLEGIMPPHITPMKHDGEIDESSLRECVRFWIESGVHGLVPCGSNGEAPYLSREERKKVIEIVVEEANGKIPVIAGTGCMSTKETIALTKDAEDVGATAALIVTPFYFRLSNREIIEHFKEISESVDIPIVLYNVPKFTGVNLEPSVIAQLAELDQVIGVKDSSGSIWQIAEIIRLAGNKLSVLAGTGDVIFPTLMLGGRGAIVAIANVAPKICVNLYEAVKSGQYSKAKELQLKLLPLNEVLTKKYGVTAVKEALNIIGKPAGYPRKPLLSLEDQSRAEIWAVLKNLMLI